MFNLRSAISLSALASSMMVSGVCAAAPVLPTGGQVKNGAVALSTTGSKMSIAQTSATAEVDWSSFSIGRGASVLVTQSNAESVLINRVTGSAASQIDGSLSATGQIFLINPNGISIGTSGSIAANGFVASTLGLSTITGGRAYNFSGTTPAAVTVEGTITGASPNSYVVLLGGTVNVLTGGKITANSVGIGAGAKATMTPPTTGGEDLALAVTSPAKGAEIDVAGAITASNGALIFNAGTLADAAINVDGDITAKDATASITVGSDPGALNLRVGNALGGTWTSAAPGSISFTGAQKNDALNINGYRYTLIWSTSQFEAMNNNLFGNYALASDLDFSGKSYTNAVIGQSTDKNFTSFAGNFNGLGHTASNLTLTSSGSPMAVGVFAALGAQNGKGQPVETSISNFNLINAQVTKAQETENQADVGGLVGYVAQKASLNNDFYSGVVNGASDLIGGLVGRLDGTVTNSAVAATVESILSSPNGPAAVGGLAGYAVRGSFITGSTSAGRVVGTPAVNGPGYVGNGLAGGLAGEDDGMISRSTSTVAVLGQTAGGLVGILFGTISYSSYNGTVTGSSSLGDLVGGLVGQSASGNIDHSIAMGTVTSTPAGSQVGGLVGEAINDLNRSTVVNTLVTNSWFKGSVVGGDNSQVGGLVGDGSYLTLTSSWSKGSAVGGNGSQVGGLVGELESDNSVTGAISQMTVSGGAQSQIGGLVGLNNALVANSYSTGVVTGGAGSNIGYLVGELKKTGTLTDAVFVTDTPSQKATHAVGKVDAGGKVTSTAGLTNAQLHNGVAAKAILGSTWFTYPKNSDPTLKSN